MSLCSFPTFSFSFSIPLPVLTLPTIDLGFTLAIPLPLRVSAGLTPVLVALLSAVARHERRVRLVFDGGARPGRVHAASGLYAREPASDGSRWPSRVWSACSGMPNQVDLALGADLQAGVVYTVGAVGVPAAGRLGRRRRDQGSPCGSRARRPCRWTPRSRPTTSPSYSTASTWSGAARTTPRARPGTSPRSAARTTCRRRSTAGSRPTGLPWDDSYGAKPRRYIDGTPGALPVAPRHAREAGAPRRPGQDRERRALGGRAASSTSA